MSPEELEVGKVYFSCGFLLRFRPVPIFEVLVYAGKNILANPSAGDLYYFQDPQVYFQEEMAFQAAELGEPYELPSDPGWCVVAAEDLASFAQDINDLRRFVENLAAEENAETVFGGLS